MILFTILTVKRKYCKIAENLTIFDIVQGRFDLFEGEKEKGRRMVCNFSYDMEDYTNASGVLVF